MCKQTFRRMQGKVNKNFVGAKSFFYFILCIGYFCIGLFSIVGFYKFIFFSTGWIIKLNLKHPLIILERTLNFILIFAMFYENLFKIFLADKF